MTYKSFIYFSYKCDAYNFFFFFVFWGCNVNLLRFFVFGLRVRQDAGQRGEGEGESSKPTWWCSRNRPRSWSRSCCRREKLNQLRTIKELLRKELLRQRKTKSITNCCYMWSYGLDLCVFCSLFFFEPFARVERRITNFLVSCKS